MNIRITDVKNFVASANCRTIVEAAAKIEISQPALSESLKRLESDLQSVLFYRSRSGIQLTPSGKVFLLKATKFLEAYNDLADSKQGARVFGDRTILVGCHPVVAQYSLPNALTYLRERAPDYKVDLRHDLSRNIQMDIQKGIIDVGIVINPTKVPDLIIQKMAVDEVHVWSNRTKFDADTIICNKHLFQTQSILRKWKNHPRRIISTDSLELVCQLVDKGIGYGIAPERAAALSGLKLNLVEGAPSYKDEIALVYRPEFGKSHPEKLIIEAFRAAFVSKKN